MIALTLGYLNPALNNSAQDSRENKIDRFPHHFRTERETGVSQLSQRLLERFLGTGKKIGQNISAPVLFLFLKWQIAEK